MKINRQLRRRGFTMVELMGAVVISSMIILLLYKVFDKVQRVFVVSQNRARAMEQGRISMDALVRDFQALDAAAQNDPLIGEIPNIEWFNTLQRDYLSPVRRFYVGSIDPFQVENLRGPQIDDRIRFSYSPSVLYQVDKDDPYEFKSTIPLPGPSDNPRWIEVDMESSDPARRQLYEALSQGLYHHRCRFFTNDGGWRHVDYRFGGRGNYKVEPTASPLGALWVYRSRLVPPADLLIERKDHELLILSDDSVGSLDEPFGYAQVLDGVVHFRVRAVSPLDPGRTLASLEASVEIASINDATGVATTAIPHLLITGSSVELSGIKPPTWINIVNANEISGTVTVMGPNTFTLTGAAGNALQGLVGLGLVGNGGVYNTPGLASPKDSFYTGKHKPSHVEVELAVADGKLVREIEEGFEQRMEGKLDSEKYQARLKYLSENLGRIYFFKQLIRMQGEEQ